MDMFDRLEKEMKAEMEEPKVVEVTAEKESVASQMVLWVFALCLIVLMLAGTVKLLTMWF